MGVPEGEIPNTIASAVPSYARSASHLKAAEIAEFHPTRMRWDKDRREYIHENQFFCWVRRKPLSTQ